VGNVVGSGVGGVIGADEGTGVIGGFVGGSVEAMDGTAVGLCLFDFEDPKVGETRGGKDCMGNIEGKLFPKLEVVGGVGMFDCCRAIVGYSVVGCFFLVGNDAGSYDGENVGSVVGDPFDVRFAEQTVINITTRPILRKESLPLCSDSTTGFSHRLPYSILSANQVISTRVRKNSDISSKYISSKFQLVESLRKIMLESGISRK
jgi:hypothetical protein